MKFGRFLPPVMLLTAALSLYGQRQATISGFVTDPSGAVVPGAQVAAVNVGTGISNPAVTNADGHYQIPALLAGTYRVSVDAKGFKTTTRVGVRLDAGEQLGLNIRLQLGAATQHVTVRTTAVNLQTENGTQSYVVYGHDIQNLAVNGRNFMDLAQLVPGAASGPTGFRGIGHFGLGGISFNGAREQAGAWLVDGAENLDLGSRNNLIVSPSEESIKEFSVKTSNYSAVYGSAGGAVINARIRSGSNAYHGSAFEFLRNDALDANYFFLNQAGQPRPKLKLNDYGFTLGGPIKRKKLYFFYSQEWRSYRAPHVFSTHTPSPQELLGDFSAWGAQQKGKKGLNSKVAGVPTGCISGWTIRSTCISPDAQALIQTGIFPAQTLPFTASENNFHNFVTSTVEPEAYHQELARIDYDISSSLKLMLHYIHEGWSQHYSTSLWAGDGFPTVGTHFILPTDSLAIRLTQIVNPKVLNEVDFQFGYKYDKGTPEGTYARPSGFNSPTVFGNNPLNRIPHLSFNDGYTGYDVGEWPYQLNTPEWSVTDMLSQVVGNQTFTYGAYYQYGIKNQPNGGDTQGSFSFNGNWSIKNSQGQLLSTGNPFADFLLGIPSSYSELNQEVMGHWRYHQFEPFFQDDWKVSPALTLNLGLRYQYIPHAYETNNNFMTWLPQLYNPATSYLVNKSGNLYCPAGRTCDYYDGEVQAGSPLIPQLGRSTTHTYYGGFAPRVGFAWRLPGLHDTVLRGGGGVGYYRNQGNDSYSLRSPQTVNVSFSYPTLDNPSGGTAASLAAPNLLALNQFYKPHQYVQYSLGIEHNFGNNTQLRVGYVGSHGSHLPRNVNYNQPGPYTDPNTGQVYDYYPDFKNSTSENPFRPYLGFGNISIESNDAASEYNSLQVWLERRWTHHLSFGVSYTLAHAMSNADGPQNAYNRSAEWARTGRANVLVFHYYYDLPFFRNQHGILGEALGGWRWSGITTFMSGTPFGVGLSGFHGLADRADLSSAGVISYPKSLDMWFAGPFYTPPAGYFGNSGRNILIGPSYQSWNMNFFKSFRLGEHLQLRIEADAFNIFNQPNFNNPNASLGNGSFDQISGTGDPRELQLGAHIAF